MPSRSQVQQLMPLMREFGALERQRLGPGVTPLEYQRWLDLKSQIDRSFAKSRAAGLQAVGQGGQGERRTRLRIAYRSREALIDSIVPNIQPAGFFVPTPFAADVGERFDVALDLEQEGESAEFPASVVTSVVEGAHTLSTMSMGMSLKILKPTPAQVGGLSKIFAGELDRDLGLRP